MACSLLLHERSTTSPFTNGLPIIVRPRFFNFVNFDSEDYDSASRQESGSCDFSELRAGRVGQMVMIPEYF